MQTAWGDMVATLAELAMAGEIGEVRRAILEQLERRVPFAGASFHTFGPDACADPATATRGTGRLLLERVCSAWASQLMELEGSPLASVAELGVARLDDIHWGSGTARGTRSWKEIFEAIGVSDTLNLFLPIPGQAPRLLVLIRDGGQRFTEAERDALGYLLPFLALAEQRGAKPVSQLPITEAQKKIVALLRFGMTNEEIARDLGKSPLTVRNQLTDIYARCGVTNRTELVAMLGGRPDDE